MAGVARARFLRRRAIADMLAVPGLADRIADYMGASGSANEYLLFSTTIKEHPEQIYPDVDLALTEGLLRVEGDAFIARQIRATATLLLSGNQVAPQSQMSRLLAPLLLLRFGDRRSLPLLKRCFDDENSSSAPLLRASAIVFASYGVGEFRLVRKSAARWMRNDLSTVVKLIERIRKYDDVPVRYKSRLKPKFDPVAGTKYVDMRGLLTVRLLHLASVTRVTKWVYDWKANVLADSISPYDKTLVRRLI